MSAQQRVQGHPALAVLLLARASRNFAQPAGALHLDALGPGLLHGLDGPFHVAEGHVRMQLVADPLGDQRGVESGCLISCTLSWIRFCRPVISSSFFLRRSASAPRPDHDARSSRVDVDAEAVAVRSTSMPTAAASSWRIR